MPQNYLKLPKKLKKWPQTSDPALRGGGCAFYRRISEISRVTVARRAPSSRAGTVAHPYPLCGEFALRTVFGPDFQGRFWRPSGTHNGSCSIPLESPICIISKDIKFAQIGVQTKKLWLPEVGVLELFFYVFPVKIPVKRGKPPANRELHVVAGVVIFPTHPDLWIKLQRAGKNPCAKAVVREEKCARFSACFPYFLSMFARTFDLAPDLGF
jgi:hypothetical protein